MIIGEYPCCNGELFIPMADGQLPRFQKEQCPHCGETVWHRHSHWEPKSWNEDAFLAEFDVNEEARTILPKEKV